jgi:membrane protease YdiL (CAAX protease family)
VTPRVLFSTQPPQGWLPWGLLVPVLAFAFMVLPLTGVAVLLDRYQLADARGPVGVTGVVALLLSAFPLIALITWGWVRGVEKRTLETIGLERRDAWRRFAHGHAIGVASVLAMVALIALLGGYSATGVLPALSSPVALGGVLLLLAGFAVQSSVEEIVFRGWMLSGIARKLNVPIAVLLTSLLFGLLHHSPDNPLAFAGTFMFSVLTCCWVLRVGHLWGVMGWHAGWNWLLATGFELPLSGTRPIAPPLITQLTDLGPKLLTGGTYGPEASALTLAALAVVSALLVWWRRAPNPAGAMAPD